MKTSYLQFDIFVVNNLNMRYRSSHSSKRRVVTHRVSGAASARRRSSARTRSSSNPVPLVLFIIVTILLTLIVLQKPETGDAVFDEELKYDQELEQIKKEHGEAEVFNLN